MGTITSLRLAVKKQPPRTERSGLDGQNIKRELLKRK